VVFQWAATMTAFSMFLLVASAAPDGPFMGSLLFVAERYIRFAQCSLILFVLMFSRFVGISWRQQSIGIVLGYGWFAGVELLVFMLYSGPVIDRVALNLVGVVAYGLSIIVWTAYMAFAAPSTLPTLRTEPNIPIIDAGTFSEVR
jgi:hypothetical protein